MAELEAGGVQVADDYHLPEVDRRALAARRDEDGFLDRMRLTYVDGVDGWIDDCLALTRPWGFEVSAVTTRTSIWYGTADVLASQDHHEYLLSRILRAERHELQGGHVLNVDQLSAVYEWLGSLDG
jgi:hypothetical protein